MSPLSFLHPQSWEAFGCCIFRYVLCLDISLLFSDPNNMCINQNSLMSLYQISFCEFLSILPDISWYFKLRVFNVFFFSVWLLYSSAPEHLHFFKYLFLCWYSHFVHIWFSWCHLVVFPAFYDVFFNTVVSMSLSCSSLLSVSLEPTIFENSVQSFYWLHYQFLQMPHYY